MKAVSVLTIAIVFLLTGLPTVHGQGQADLPHVKATRVQADVKVDGRLDEAVWKDVPVMSGFQALTGKKKAVAAPEETRFQVAFNDHALLIGIVCREPRMGELIGDVTERDGSVWRDDSVEIFVQPGPRFYYHLGVNSRGTLYDARVPVTVQVTEKDIREGRLWDGVWEAVVSRATDAWTIEARIPFATLDLSPDTPSTWRLNVGRTAARRVEYSAWAPVEKGFHDLPRFGYLDGLRLDTSRFVLDGSGIAFPPLFVGNNHVPLSLPVRRDGRFRVGTSLREWSPGPPPERRPQGGPVAASGGNLPVTLTVPVVKSGALHEFVLEIADAATGAPVLLRAHLFKAPQAFDASLSWAVSYQSDREAVVEVTLAVASGSARGRLSAKLLGDGPSVVAEQAVDLTQPDAIRLPIPFAKVPDGFYRVQVSADLPDVGRFSKELRFFKTKGPFD